MSEQWKMPEWMEPYREMIEVTNERGKHWNIEGHMAFKANHRTYVTSHYVRLKAQTDLLERLHEAGMLVRRWL